MVMCGVMYCRGNPGNVTSPGDNNTFEIRLPPGITPVGPVTPGPGSPPCEYGLLLGLNSTQCMLVSHCIPHGDWVFSVCIFRCYPCSLIINSGAGPCSVKQPTAFVTLATICSCCSAKSDFCLTPSLSRAVVCVSTNDTAGGTVITCQVPTDLPPNTTW